MTLWLRTQGQYSGWNDMQMNKYLWWRLDTDSHCVLRTFCAGIHRLLMNSQHKGTAMPSFGSYFVISRKSFEQTVEWPVKWDALSPHGIPLVHMQFSDIIHDTHVFSSTLPNRRLTGLALIHNSPTRCEKCHNLHDCGILMSDYIFVTVPLLMITRMHI